MGKGNEDDELDWDDGNGLQMLQWFAVICSNPKSVSELLTTDKLQV
jgi:hypothetical protein